MSYLAYSHQANTAAFRRSLLASYSSTVTLGLLQTEAGPGNPPGFLSGETLGAEQSVGPDASAGTACEIGRGGQTDGQRGSSWLVRAAIATLGNADVLTMGQALATSACYKRLLSSKFFSPARPG